MASKLLGIFPHPDDETYAAGGLLARCAAAGAEVTVVSATRGEAGFWRETPSPRAEPLGAVRTRELQAACAVLGAPPPRFLDLPDGRLAELEPDVGPARLEALLREERPQVVVTLGPDGVYGHRDHRAVTRWVETAAGRLPPGQAPRVLYAVFPRGLFAPLWRSLRRLPAIDAEIDEESLGTVPEAVHLRLRLDEHRGTKLAALAAHASQLRAGEPDSFLRPGIIAPLLEEEWFVVAAGPPLPPGSTDPFALP